MKRLLLIFILTISFNTLTKANDITDFQIEGMSLGDSALEFFTEEEINKNIRINAYEGSDGKFYDAGLNNANYEIYDLVALVFKKNDPKYIIYSISGMIFFDNDSKACNEKYKEIVLDIEVFFDDHEKNIKKNVKHNQDKSGKSFYNGTSFIHKTRSGADIACYTWSKEMDISDYTSVSIDTADFGYWLDSYYN